MNEFQARYDGGAVVIQCDSRWSCCQRAQAVAKVNAMNRELNKPPTKKIRDVVTDDMNAEKTKCQSRATTYWDNMSKDEKKAHLKKVGSPECVADGRSQDPNALEQDHPLDTKWGGETGAKPSTLDHNMMPLDKAVNGAFGLLALGLGDKMTQKSKANPYSNKVKEVDSFSLICPAGGDCPGEDHNAGRRKNMPDDPSDAAPTKAERGRQTTTADFASLL